MRPSRITEKQIIGRLKEEEACAKTSNVSRKDDISSAIFYKFKAKYFGMDVSDARRLKVLEDENARLGKRLAEQDEHRVPKGCRCKTGHARCEAEGGGLCLRVHGVSQRRACQALDRALCQHRSDAVAMREAMKTVAAERRPFGCRKIHVKLLASTTDAI